MKTDWNVLCGSDDPIVVVPWANKNETLRYFDLRSKPDLIKEIPEAARYDSIAAALQRWNQPDSSIFTAKCDVWAYPSKLFDAEDLEEFEFAHGSYIDLLPRNPEIFSSFQACEKQLRLWSEMAGQLDLPRNRCEWSLRPAQILRSIMHHQSDADDVYLEGFATTFYLWGYGVQPSEAASVWSAALFAMIDPICQTVNFPS